VTFNFFTFGNVYANGEVETNVNFKPKGILPVEIVCGFVKKP
jgi:hypothetical protein